MAFRFKSVDVRIDCYKSYNHIIMEIYLLILAVSILTYYGNKSQPKNGKILFVFIFLMFVCGLRGLDVGTDTAHYFYGYQTNVERHEPLSKLIKAVSLYFNNGYQTYLFLFSIATYIPLIWFIKKESPNFALSAIVYITFSVLFFHQTMNTVRACASVSYFMICIYYLEHDSFKKAFVFLVISTLFHYSLLLTIPFILIAYYVKIISHKVVVLAIILSLIFGFTFATGFSEYTQRLSVILSMYSGDDTTEYYMKYIDNLTEAQKSNIGLAVSMLPFSLLAILLPCNNYKQNLYYKLFIMGVIVYNVFISVQFVYRITMFFSLFLTILYPKAFYELFGWKKIMMKATALFLILFYIYTLFKADETTLAGTIPYKFFWQ